jgi:hypothetical protein
MPTPCSPCDTGETSGREGLLVDRLVALSTFGSTRRSYVDLCIVWRFRPRVDGVEHGQVLLGGETLEFQVQVGGACRITGQQLSGVLHRHAVPPSSDCVFVFYVVYRSYGAVAGVNVGDEKRHIATVASMRYLHK